MLYMVTFTISIPPMLAYIPCMDPMGHESIKTRSADVSDEITRLSGCPSPVFSWRRENFSRTVTPRRDGEALNKWLVVKKPLMNLLQPKFKRKKHPPEVIRLLSAGIYTYLEDSGTI